MHLCLSRRLSHYSVAKVCYRAREAEGVSQSSAEGWVTSDKAGIWYEAEGSAWRVINPRGW